MLKLVSVLAMWASVTGFFLWLLIDCLRRGVVGSGSVWRRGDAHRDKQPIRYWTGIAALAIGVVGIIGNLIFAMTR